MVKLRSDGTKAWDKTFGGNRDDLLTSLQQTRDGGYILGGFSESERSNDKSDALNGEADYWVIKLDTKGNKVWDKTFGGDSGDYGQFLQQTGDGGYLVGGYSNSEISGDKSGVNKGGYDYWVIKLQADGSKDWDKTYGGNADDKLSIFQQTSDGGYLLGGSSNSGRSSDKSESSRGNDDYWVIKVTADGIPDWDRTLGGSDFENLQFLQENLDGGYLLGGYSYSGRSGDKTQVSEGGSDYWIVTLDSDGTKDWDKSYGGNGDDFLSAFQQTSEGDYILGGSASYGISGDKTEAGKGNLDYWIVKVKEDGAIIWDKTIGGDSYELLNTILKTTDGGYIMGGWSLSGKTGDKAQSSRGDFDYWVVKIRDLKNPYNPYCVPAITYACTSVDLYISDFSFHTLNNNSPGCNGKENSYINYNPTGSRTTTVNKGQSYEFSLQSGPDHPQGFGIWIDYNNDQDFEDAGEFVYNAAEPLTGSVTGTITIPANATEGPRRLRVRTKYNSTFADDEFCTATEYGETEDYTITIAKTSATTQWNRRYGGSGADNLTITIKTADEGYLTGGYSPSGDNGDKTQASEGKNDYWIVKTDAAGKKLWDKTFGGSDHDYLNQVIPTLDGGYLLGGSSLSDMGGDKSQDSRGNRDYWIVKISGSGEKQWDQRFGGSGYDELKKVIQLPTGEYLLAGYSNSPANGDKSQDSRGGNDFWLVKISRTGTKIWDKRYGGNLNEALDGIVPTPGGGFLLGGHSASGRNGDKSQESRGGNDFWLVRIDKKGDKLWDKSFGGSGQDELYTLGQTNDHIFLAGQSDSPASGDKSQDSQGENDFWLLKITNDGTKIWDKRFGGNQNDELRASVETSDGSYLLAGHSFSGKSGNKTQPSRGRSDYWVVKVNEDGLYQWDKRFGGSGSEELRAVLQTTDGGLLLGGKSTSGVSGDRTQPSQGGMDYWLIKIDPETMPISSPVARADNFVEEPTTLADQVNLQASPNPFAAQVTIRFTLPESQPVAVKIYDSQGREIATLFQGQAQANQVYQLEWQAHNQAAGVYLLQLQTPTTRNQHKLLLTR